MGCTNCYSGDMWWEFVMGRVIKFRAWHPSNKEMVIFDNEKASKDHYIARHLLLLMANKSVQGKDLLMQFTGLTDKNGVDIYERDIVDVLIDGERFIIDVSFDVDRDLNGWNVIPQHVNDGIEVIGNIHQNPELLK